MTEAGTQVLDATVESRVAARDLDRLFRPKVIAVVGASDRNVHSTALLNNLNASYDGAVYPVNPGRSEVAGLPCYPSVRELPEVPDLAVLLVGRDSVLGVLRELAAVGAGAAIINADGFAESTMADGKALQAEIAALAKESGILLLGPNGLGFQDVASHAFAFCAPLSGPLRPGRLAIISQSGGNCVAFADSAIDRGLGLSHLVSTGNEVDVTLSDSLDYLVDDPNVGAFCMYVEAIRDPETFLRAALRAKAAGKPVIAIKVGRSEVGRAAALAHTGAITGSDAAVDAIFERAGVVRAGTIDEALDRAAVVAQLPREIWPRGGRTIVFTMGGGAASILADGSALTRIQILPLPAERIAEFDVGIPEGVSVKNPIDVPGAYFGPIPNVVVDFIRAGLVGDDYDLAIAALPMPSSRNYLRGLVEVQHETGKPVIITTPSRVRADELTREFMIETGLAIIPGLGEALAGIDAVLGFVEAANRPVGQVPDSPAELETLRAEVAAVAASGATVLEPELAERLLVAYGIAVPRSKIAVSLAEALAIKREFSGAVALKAAASEVHHKTELGGVRLGLRKAGEVATAYTEVTAATAGHPDGEKVLIQEMVEDGLELILGISNGDAGFPPTVVVGLGGILVELLSDTSVRLAPVTVLEAREMLASLRGFDLLQGFRGQPPRDVDAVAAAVSALSRLAIDFADLIGAVDVNPIIVGKAGAGVKAVDALVILGAPSRPGE